ncbi:MAG: Ribosomal-protein-alanine acetyltransferase [Candidatus Woesebacteria bacterium GW2011_GWA1_37_8]|uniref:Ribosomal-protein-alanine acetyltransferase n=2 Tax=Candidatus Woeseibacteriota TaxID=1752722 RepID=A0A0G0NLJ2_9BACT|nr:MAG: Ribosomal-protein-alanine acetyltransferase [Candidatus Woesebacteria bacterium GW2011_GWA1_37_8]KKQ86764.1 MAG: Ribosomal-protein-alanine acetyltransferase [Candidatus Woesebacteria bacterium GW2011_GWB1_38_8b]
MKLAYKRLTEKDWKTTTSIEKAVADGKVFKAFTKASEASEYLRKSVVYLVLIGEKPIGTISYEPKSQVHAYIDSMTILPEYQGKGYASESLEWLLTKIEDKKVIDLVTHPQNSKAICIYLEHGFMIEGWKDNYFGDGEPRLHLVLAKK